MSNFAKRGLWIGVKEELLIKRCYAEQNQSGITIKAMSKNAI